MGMIGLGQFTHRGVLGAGGDAVIVERIPFDVQNVSSVARHSRVVRVHFTCLAKHKHKKTPRQAGNDCCLLSCEENQ